MAYEERQREFEERRNARRSNGRGRDDDRGSRSFRRDSSPYEDRRRRSPSPYQDRRRRPSVSPERRYRGGMDRERGRDRERSPRDRDGYDRRDRHHVDSPREFYRRSPPPPRTSMSPRDRYY
ncbi:peptidyl-prolyl cis-trans isomerase sig-7-like [Macrobrachium nipponense]|uniref:peptidyl-prolyl cis-trans isomerase sig-7-like n=1 Tax=Macrobrachium nipponense TaxID=159736 RepID=UPI0030C81794